MSKVVSSFSFNPNVYIDDLVLFISIPIFFVVVKLENIPESTRFPFITKIEHQHIIDKE